MASLTQTLTRKTNFETKRVMSSLTVPREEQLLTPSSVTTAVRMKTNGNKKARKRIVWKRVR